MLWVPSSWFTRDYVKHERWVEIWSECLRVDYAAGARTSSACGQNGGKCRKGQVLLRCSGQRWKRA
ncbi:protein rep [Escherichia coli]|nr:protein rep [Escherichia coli]